MLWSPADRLPPPLLADVRRTPVVINGTPGVISALGLEATYAARRFGDTMCFAGNWGVACLAGERWLLFGAASGLSTAGATSVAMDNRGHLWVGSIDRGLFHTSMPLEQLFRETASVEVAKRVFIPAWTKATGAPTDGIRSLASHDNRLWVGTGDGLAVLTIEKPFSAKNVFAGQPVVGMTPSLDGRSMWVSNNAGLVEIDTRTLRQISRVTKADGLIDDEAWAYGPLATDSAGRIYLGTPSGVSVFNPGAARAQHACRPSVRLRDTEMPRQQRDRARIRRALVRRRIAQPLSHAAGRLRPRTGRRKRRIRRSATRTCRRTSSRAATRSRSRPRNADGVWSQPLAYQFNVVPPVWLRWWAVLGLHAPPSRWRSGSRTAGARGS